jgi:hypothetical protein
MGKSSVGVGYNPRNVLWMGRSRLIENTTINDPGVRLWVDENFPRRCMIKDKYVRIGVLLEMNLNFRHVIETE